VILVANRIPNLERSRIAVNQAHEVVLPQAAAVRYQSAADKTTTAKAMVSTALVEAGAATDSINAAVAHKMIRTGSVDLVVRKPAEAAETIRALAENMGGFLVNSNVGGGANATSGSLTIRVPAARFEATWAEIRKLGLRVETEKIEAQDVTRQYVDQEASLRNLRAEEVQYLGILKEARTVKDMLQVSERLTEVRGQIDQQQAEFDALSKQVETVAISISLRTEAEARVFGLHWRPLYQMKVALRDGLEAVADYGVAMTSFLFYLPAVLLWMGTIVVGAGVGWKVVRWAGRVWFAWPKQESVQNG
jgi:hypothetical protein